MYKILARYQKNIIMMLLSLGTVFVNFCSAQTREMFWCDYYRFATVFISYQDTITKKMNKSTGFMVNNYQNDSTRILVFCRHILGNTSHFDIKAPLRLMLQSGDTVMSTAVQRIRIVDTNGVRLWRALSDTHVDIAVVETGSAWKYANPGEKVIDKHHIEMDTSCFANKYELYEGDFVYFTGYPLGLAGEISPFPMTRFGVIASLHGEEILKRRLFIIDGSGFSGSSGSPVVLAPISIVQSPYVIGGGKKLIGVQIGYKDMYPVVDSMALIENKKTGIVDTMIIRFQTKENSHLMVVAPVELIRKTLALIDPEWNK
ncbi:hypothetical protein A2Y85_07160 [candidate division WOR-3 bacterium RBG_13_43_14]|uniref:Serine protease n=1 Tax=candidate division WOR-3 bacterium RBG_13_43_14 TaxID=1802590 RepID=A0A1F4UAC6_UNCW3|nr:MAG: hypothetical protein A2Y85_07160 [candidate division WOR-3 bacterium RBG_13_43_14]